jgi:deoxycytidylate deaminase/NTP pyrophosphatase (non-canonical NTP hydrolase)
MNIEQELQRTYELANFFNPDPNTAQSSMIIVEEMAEFIAEFSKRIRTREKEQTVRKTDEEVVDDIIGEAGDVIFVLATALRAMGQQDSSAFLKAVKRVNDKNEEKLLGFGRLSPKYLEKRKLRMPKPNTITYENAFDTIINPSFRDFAKEVWDTAQLSTCKKTRHGVVIVKNGVIIGRGQNRTPAGVVGCVEQNSCRRDNLGEGTEARYYDACRCIHAEPTAVFDALNHMISHPSTALTKDILVGTHVYLWSLDTKGKPRKSEPCEMCKKLVLENGIDRVITPEMTYSVAEYSKRWE